MTLLSSVLRLSIRHRGFVALLFLLVAVLGARAFARLPIDAIPDITNVQVQINSAAPALAPVEVERRITIPVETAMAGLPGVEHTRSLSRYGLSQVTVVFEDGTDLHFARQLVAERLATARENLPEGVTPELGPIATGLGEIYMWTLQADPDATRADGKPFDLSDLRTLEDWVVRPRIRNVAGVTEVNAIGGFEKTFRVAPEPDRLMEYGVSFHDVADAITRSNGTAGGGYLERDGESQLVRATGVLETEDDLRGVVVGHRDGVPIRVRDVATVSIGHDLRTGAATVDGDEAVIGTAIMLVGENSRTVSIRVREQLESIQASLPPGVRVVTLYDRTYLVDDTIRTVEKNLLEGALLVILVLFLLLGNLRAALIVSIVIPVAMAAAVIGMLELDVSGNLMSLGAIDFGLLVDGSVIVVESSVRRFAEERHRLGRRLAKKERLALSYEAAREVLESAVFGQLIIGAVYLPVLTLTGIEGKMFRPMAITVILALGAATLLAMTLMPALVALALGGEKEEKSSRLFGLALRGYTSVLERTLRHRALIVAAASLVLVVAAVLASTLGTEFSPKLGEGAIAIQPARIPSMGLTESVALQRTTERTLLEAFPDEIATVFARTGTAEVATDPMGPNVSDAYVMLRPRAGWTKARTQEELAEKISETLEDVPGQSYEISQPIELRFNELISGVRTDVAVLVYGDDLEAMLRDAQKVAALLREVPGATDVKVEQVSGLPVLTVRSEPERLSRYGLTVDDVNEVVELGIGGKDVGHVFDGERRFPISVRLPDAMRVEDGAIDRLPIALPHETGAEAATFVPLGTVADLLVEEGPNQISRENGKRRVVVQCGVRGRDLGGFVAEARQKIAKGRPNREGTFIEWGGQYENLVDARERLAWVVPLALLAVLGLIYASVGSLRNALLIFTGVPLASTGGILALSLRGIPLSISAVIGFIALSGVAVQNGLVMVTFIERLRRGGATTEEAVRLGSTTRLRPVLMTALVAAIGFIPMALATGRGAEVQRPLATVVIGGILSSTLLTLVVLPALYALVPRRAPAEDADADAPSPDIGGPAGAP